MVNTELAEFYQRDIEKLITELNLVKDEEALWKTTGTIKNSCGNLTLHLIGNLSYYIGKMLGHSGYVRNRELEFSAKNVSRHVMTDQLRALIPLIVKTITSISDQQLDEPYPEFFTKENASIRHVLTHLLLHLNYHTGQLNYLRRALE